jgi:thiamine biosynthesis lipoprotein
VLSDYRPASNVSRLNRRETDVLEPETRLLLERAQRICRESDGAFDVGLRRLKELWGFGGGRTPAVPDSTAIAALIAHAGCDVFTITGAGRLQWNDAVAEIDLGGIAQGYVCERIAALLRARGIDRFLVDVSGDLVAGGERAGGGAWRIGIQDPRRPDSLLATLTIDSGAVTTSGDYEQFFEAGGRRFHHVFDPRTGWPAERVQSVTVVTPDPVAADAYAKVVFVLGPERGFAFLESRPELRGVIVSANADGGRHVQWTHDLAPARP